MRAVICRAWGSVDDLTLEDVAPPTPGPGQLLIDVKATGVNYADAIMVAGRYQTQPPFPFRSGLETAGVVARCGEGVTRYTPGDRVMAILAYGGCAEQALAEEARPLPSRTRCRSTTRAPSPSRISPAMWRSAGRGGWSAARRCWCWVPRAASA